MTKDEIKDYLQEMLSSVYCNNCSHVNDDNCDECHRKAMGWGLSETAAQEMAETILNN